MPSVFVLEHGRLWLVAQRGYAVVPDGITVETGITGRAIRLGRPQFAPNVRVDPDYVAALPGIVSELAVPLRSGPVVVGVVNIESERALPDGAADAIRPLVRALAPLAGEFVPAERWISLRSRASLRTSAASASLLTLRRWAQRRFRRSSRSRPARSWSGTTSACPPSLQPGGRTGRRSLRSRPASSRPRAPRPTRASSARSSISPHPIGAGATVCRLAAASCQRERARSAGGDQHRRRHVDPVVLDTAAVLAAHVAASLDAAFALRRERVSAVTDPLTGILNRRGLEERLERELPRPGAAHADERARDRLRRLQGDQRPGRARVRDALLREVADVLTRSLPEGANAARLGGDEFVVMLPARAPTSRRRSAARSDATRRRPHRRGVPAADLRRGLDVPLRRCGADGAAACGRPGAVRRQGRRQGSRRLVPRARVPLRSGAAEAAGPSDGGAWPTRRMAVLADAGGGRRRSRPRTRSEPCALGCARRSCSSSARPHARRRASSATTSSTRATTRSARWRSGRRRLPDRRLPTHRGGAPTGEPRAVSFADGDVDPAEAFILRELG